MDNRRLFLAALLSLAVLLGWQYLFPPPEAAQPVRPVPTAEAAAVATATATVPAPAPVPAPESAVAVPELPPLAASVEEKVTVETEALVAIFSNRGAVLESLRLRSDLEGIAGGIELVQRREKGPFPFGLVDASGASIAADDALFVSELVGDGSERGVVFRYRGVSGSVEKRFRFRPDGLLAVEVECRCGGDWGVVLGPGLRELSAKELGSRFEQRAGSWLSGGTMVTVVPADAKETKVVGGETLGWVGLEDTYFLSAAIPQGAVSGAALDPVLLKPGGKDGVWEAVGLPAELSKEQEKWPRDLRLRLMAKGERLSLLTFWGAKQYDHLAAMPYGFEKTVRWGMWGFLARPLLYGLQWIHAHVVENYGWSIVLMTGLLKVLLLPLTLSAFSSMQKMQRLNPKIQAIREKARPKLRDSKGRSNPEAQRQMNEEIMALYKTEGVNPAGGCLPMLLQVPVFFAFYNLLSNAVELWHAPWIGWIRDLTAPDPYYVLPILMGVTQVLQQRLTPSAGDPFQRRMMQAFPIIFTVFSLGFASGLVLYWLVNNVLTIGQQLIYNAVRPATAPAGSSGRGRGEKGK